TRRRRAGFFGPDFVRVAPGRARGRDLRRSEVVAEPAQAQARTLGHGHDVPAPAHGVAEGVDSSGAVEARAVGVGEQDAARPDRRADDPGLDDAVADAARRLIAPAA